ncbi:hypothetical protein [Fibrella aquatica]|uniref:hypothetical protein n=1 Tax=Fibrella aquatica TaxID=3242487 RepID=UPI003521BB31
MIIQTQPNLFAYATSELSQDAFICWLAEWADPKWKHVDPILHQTGQAFVADMIHKVHATFNPSTIETVNVKPQFEKLDILIEINKNKADKLAILVEDKTHTSNHSGQLDRYYKIVQEAGYGVSQMVPLYFKTGYQSRFDTIGKFKTYLRHDFLAVLQRGKQQGVANAIYDDFLAHLQKVDFLIKQFSIRPVDKWEYHDWVGFFTVLYDQRSTLSSSSEDDGANWGYVANPSGGFVGYWWYFKPQSNKTYMPYLQLEQNILCFKIEVTDPANQKTAQDEANRLILQAARQLGLSGVERPKYMRTGRAMTVAYWKEYMVLSGDNLDSESTIENLIKAQVILDTAFPS